jgi:ferredoxin-NADP reductase
MPHFFTGQYVRVTAPLIAKAISHPFTINPVPGQPNQLCIIFRSTGKFTTQLASFLLDGRIPTADKKRNGHPGSKTRPFLTIDGFYGPSCRTSQVLQHDVVVLVAGGVGITPFLTLLHRVCDSMNQNRGITKKVVLHWVCREEALFKHVKQVFFDPLLARGSSAGVSMILSVHLTGTAESAEFNDDPESIGDKNDRFVNGRQESALGGASMQEMECIDDTESRESIMAGVPFSPSKFTPLSKRTYKGNLLPFISSATNALAGLWVVWYFYKHVQTDQSVSTRLLSPVLVVMLAVVTGTAANIATRYFYWLDSEEDFVAVPVTFTSVDKPNDDSFEMINKLHNAHSTEEFAVDETASASSSHERVALEVNKGRPDVTRLLRCLDQGSRPGVFLCGPESLVENVKLAVGGNTGCANLSRCGHVKISLYEESFIL